MDSKDFLIIFSAVVLGVCCVCINVDYNFKELKNDIHVTKDDLNDKISVLKTDVMWIKFRLDPNEHPSWLKERDKQEN